MRVAIVGFCGKHSQYGGAQGPHHNAVNILNRMWEIDYDVNAEYVMIGEPNAEWQNYIKSEILYYPLGKFAESLNRDFDKAIFITPAPHSGFDKDEHYKELSRIEIPLFFLIQSERESIIYPGFAEYLEDNAPEKIILQSESELIQYQDHSEFLYTISRSDPLQSSGWTCTKYLSQNYDIYEQIRHKRNSIVSNSRWASWKRVFELAQISPALVKAGLDIYIAGSTDDVEKKRWIEGENPTCWNNIGQYGFLDAPRIVLQERLLWNPAGFPDRNTIKRLEYSAIEGIWHGCVPILSEEICPTWFQGDHMIAIQSQGNPLFAEQALQAILEFNSFPALRKSDMAMESYLRLRANINLPRLMGDFQKILDLEML